jgi:hypothetical protein
VYWRRRRRAAGLALLVRGFDAERREKTSTDAERKERG